MAPAIRGPTARTRARPTPTTAAAPRAARPSRYGCEVAWTSCHLPVHASAHLGAMAAERVAVAGGGAARFADVDADVPHDAPAVHDGDSVGQVNGLGDVVRDEQDRGAPRAA